MPKGKYARRRAARLHRERGPVTSTELASIFRASNEMPDTGEWRAPYLYNKHFGRDELEANQMGLLRDIAKYKGVKVGRLRKAELIDAIIAKQANDG